MAACVENASGVAAAASNMSMELGLDAGFQEQLLWFQRAESLIDRYVTGAICVLGLAGNTLTILVLTRKSLTRHLGVLERSVLAGLLALAVSDLLFCLATFPQAWQDRTAFGRRRVDGWLVYEAYGSACINCFLLCSSWLTVAMAVCRYLVIRYPTRGRLWLGMKATRAIILAVALLSLLFNLPRFWQRQIAWVECADGGRSYFTVSGFMETQHTARVTYTWLYFVAGILLPLMLLMYCNIFLVRALQVARRLKQHHGAVMQGGPVHVSDNKEAARVVTLTLCIIVVLYIVLVAPAELVAFWKPFIGDENMLYYGLAVRVCNAMQMLNFAINFILYFIINVHFRKVIKDLVFCLHLREHIQAPPSHTQHDNTTHETSLML